MITVYYFYLSKFSHKWLEGRTKFTEPEKARRFMYSQRKRNTIICNYICDNPEDTSYLNSKTNLMYINRGKFYDLY